MKILFLTPRFAPAIGGVEHHVSRVTEELSAQHEVTIITSQHEPELPLQEKTTTAQVYRLRFQPEFLTGRVNKRQLWRELWQYRRVLWQSDVIHVHDVFYWYLPFRFLFFWKPVFITFHGYEAPGPLTAKQVFWHRVAAWLTNGNLCVGEFHKKWYRVKPSVVTYGGRELLAVDDATKSKKKKLSSIKKGYFIGRLANDTGIMTYLKALTFSDKPAKQVKLEVYGDGPLRSECMALAKKEKLPVEFHGAVKNPHRFLGDADFVLASQYLSILNALSLGKPVIAVADTPIKSDYLRLTPFGQWIEIVELPSEVANLLQQPLSLATSVVEWARSQTWSAVAQQYITLWQRSGRNQRKHEN